MPQTTKSPELLRLYATEAIALWDDAIDSGSVVNCAKAGAGLAAIMDMILSDGFLLRDREGITSAEREHLADRIEAAVQERFDIGSISDSLIAAGYRRLVEGEAARDAS